MRSSQCQTLKTIDEPLGEHTQFRRRGSSREPANRRKMRTQSGTRIISENAKWLQRRAETQPQTNTKRQAEQTRSLEPGYCVAVFGGPSLHNQSKLMATLYFVCHPYYTVTLKRQMKFRRYELLYSGPIYPLLLQFHSPNTLHAGRPYCLHSHRWSPLPHFPLSLFLSPFTFPQTLVVPADLSTSYSHGEHKPAAQINPCGLTVLISKYSPFLPERSLAQQWPQWEKANPQLSIKSFAGLQS